MVGCPKSLRRARDRTDRRFGRRTPAARWSASASTGFILVAGNRLLNDPDSYGHLAVGRWIMSSTAQCRSPIPSPSRSRTGPIGSPRNGSPKSSMRAPSRSAAGAAWSSSPPLRSRSPFRLWPPRPRFLVDGAGAAARRSDLVAVAFHACSRRMPLARPSRAGVAGNGVALRRRARPCRRSRPPPVALALLPLMVLWANLHGGFTLGLLLTVAAGLDAIVSAAADRSAPRPRANGLDRVCGGSLPSSLRCITPYGPESILASPSASSGSARRFRSSANGGRPDFGHLAGVWSSAFSAGSAWRSTSVSACRRSASSILLGLASSRASPPNEMASSSALPGAAPPGAPDRRNNILGARTLQARSRRGPAEPALFACSPAQCGFALAIAATRGGHWRRNGFARNPRVTPGGRRCRPPPGPAKAACSTLAISAAISSMPAGRRSSTGVPSSTVATSSCSPLSARRHADRSPRSCCGCSMSTALTPPFSRRRRRRVAIPRPRCPAGSRIYGDDIARRARQGSKARMSDDRGQPGHLTLVLCPPRPVLGYLTSAI